MNHPTRNTPFLPWMAMHPICTYPVFDYVGSLVCSWSRNGSSIQPRGYFRGHHMGHCAFRAVSHHNQVCFSADVRPVSHLGSVQLHGIQICRLVYQCASCWPLSWVLKPFAQRCFGLLLPWHTLCSQRWPTNSHPTSSLLCSRSPRRSGRLGLCGCAVHFDVALGRQAKLSLY